MTVAAELGWAVGTHPGNVRESNQDATLGGPTVFAVADGMGGHACGELASATAITKLAEATDHDLLTIEIVLDGIEQANRAVLGLVATRPECLGMGTTLAGIAILPGDEAPIAVAFNIGDSRVYHRTARGVGQITQDHSVVGELLRSGTIDRADAADHPSRHVVTRALGLGPVIETDRWILELTEGDRLLVCSDGLINELSEGELDDALQSAESPQTVVDHLVEEVLGRTARDNLSVVLVEVRNVVMIGSDGSEDTHPRSALPPSRSDRTRDD